MKYIILLTMFSLISCSTIHFTNGPAKSDVTRTRKIEFDPNKWHHVGVLSFVEFSDPVELSQTCDGKNWDTITVNRQLPQIIVGAIPFVGNIWSPWALRYACDNQ